MTLDLVSDHLCENCIFLVVPDMTLCTIGITNVHFHEFLDKSDIYYVYVHKDHHKKAKELLYVEILLYFLSNGVVWMHVSLLGSYVGCGFCTVTTK